MQRTDRALVGDQLPRLDDQGTRCALHQGAAADTARGSGPERAPAARQRSRTKLYNALYTVLGPRQPLLETFFPKFVTTSEQVARAMLEVARHCATQRILENPGLNAIHSKAG